MSASTTRSIKTIRRDTKRHRAIVEGAWDVDCYSLSNNFEGKPVNSLVITDYVFGRFASPHSKLTEGGRLGKPYTLHVHSNLWFEFRSKT